MIEIQNITKIYGKQTVLKNVTAKLEEGKIYGLVGVNGSGKTTLMRCICGFTRPTSGKVIVNGKVIGKDVDFPESTGIIIETPGFLAHYSGLRNLKLLAGVSHKADEARARAVMKMVKLNPDNKKTVGQYSLGMRQRLGIARALACNPKLIVCDEPVSALDVSIQAQIINLFAALQKKLGLTYIFVAHDLAVVRHIADRIAVMYLGHIVELMDAEDLFRNSLHPYTVALLSAVPTTDYYAEKKRTRIVLKGEVPSPLRAPKGCPFHPRCEYATEECRSVMPPLQDVGGGHCVACYHQKKMNG